MTIAIAIAAALVGFALGRYARKPRLLTVVGDVYAGRYIAAAIAEQLAYEVEHSRRQAVRLRDHGSHHFTQTQRPKDPGAFTADQRAVAVEQRARAKLGMTAPADLARRVREALDG